VPPLATINLLEGGLVENAAARGEQAMRGLRELAAAHDGFVTDVRGRGLMIGIEFDSAVHAEEVEWACFQRGLLVLECGRSTLRMAPALVVNEQEVDTALRIFGEAVAAVAHGSDAISATATAALAAHQDPIEAAV